MNGLDIYKFIKPHLGSINATGSHSADMQRLEFLKTRSELLNCLVEDLEYAYLDSRKSQEHSIQAINKSCMDEMIRIHGWLNDYISDYLKETGNIYENKEEK